MLRKMSMWQEWISEDSEKVTILKLKGILHNMAFPTPILLPNHFNLNIKLYLLHKRANVVLFNTYPFTLDCLSDYYTVFNGEKCHNEKYNAKYICFSLYPPVNCLKSLAFIKNLSPYTFNHFKCHACIRKCHINSWCEKKNPICTCTQYWVLNVLFFFYFPNDNYRYTPVALGKTEDLYTR